MDNAIIEHYKFRESILFEGIYYPKPLLDH